MQGICSAYPGLPLSENLLWLFGVICGKVFYKFSFERLILCVGSFDLCDAPSLYIMQDMSMLSQLKTESIKLPMNYTDT